jgi:hypothetical protein
MQKINFDFEKLISKSVFTNFETKKSLSVFTNFKTKVVFQLLTLFNVIFQNHFQNTKSLNYNPQTHKLKEKFEIDLTFNKDGESAIEAVRP